MLKTKMTILIFISFLSISCFNMNFFNKKGNKRQSDLSILDTTKTDSSLNLKDIDFLDLELENIDD